MKTPVRMSGRPFVKKAVPSPIQQVDLREVGDYLVKLDEMQKALVLGMAQLQKTSGEYVQMKAACVDMQSAMGVLQKAFEDMRASYVQIKTGPEGRPGMPGSHGNDGESVDTSVVVAEVARLFKQPRDGVAPTVEEVVKALLPKVVKRLKSTVPTAEEVIPVAVHEPVDTAALMDQLFEEIKSGKRKLTVAHIDGLDAKFGEVRNAAAMGNAEVKQYGKNTWARGGGDTVVAGPGVVITNTPDGTKKITATGSGGFSIITVTGVIDDSNVTFTAASEPTLLNINGAFYKKTGGSYTWGYVSGTITLNVAVGTGGSIFGI